MVRIVNNVQIVMAMASARVWERERGMVSVPVTMVTKVNFVWPVPINIMNRFGMIQNCCAAFVMWLVVMTVDVHRLDQKVCWIHI